MLYRLATGMDSSRFQSRVVSLIEPGPMGRKLKKAGIQVDSLGMHRGVPSPVGLFRLMNIIRQWKPDVVQTWLYHADLAGLVAARLAHPFGGGPKVVWNIRCSFMALEEYRRMTGITLRLCSALSGLPDGILSNSEEARRFHRELGYSASRFEVIPNGFDVERFAPDTEARIEVREELSIDDAVIIGHVARFDAMKDHRTFIRAAAQVAKQSDAVFVLVGREVDYDNLDLATWMSEAGLDANRVRLLGERDDVTRIMAAMDVHVSSSIGESFPNVVGEAMGCGVPNVVTDVGDSRILVGETGLVVAPGDAAGLAKAMLRMINDPQERMAKGRAARERIESVYSLPSVIGRYESLYNDLYY